MTDNSTADQLAAPATVRAKNGISLVWIVPLVALAIGAWLGYKAITDKGPVIQLTFPSAEGLEAGKTKIKFKDVVIGQVDSIRLGEDLKQVFVTAELSKDFKPFLNDKTRFWVATAQIRGGTVSGLGTLLSGAYIGVDPVLGGTPTLNFKGLDVPPIVTTGLPGRHFRINTQKGGSISVGMPVYFRKIQVGQVVSYGFSSDGRSIDIKVFIEAPHHTKVTQNTRFWNASGFDVSLSAQGLKVDTESVVSILSGGISFDIPKDSEPGDEAAEATVFQLYPDHDSINNQNYSLRTNWRINFDQSVRGLAVGAPVEVYGIKIGEVVKIDLIYDEKKMSLRVPVVVAIEPERISNILKSLPADTLEALKKNKPDAAPLTMLKWFVEQKNMRAQLKTGNLLTGQLLIDLGFHPQEQKVALAVEDGQPIIPSIPGSLDQIQESIANLTQRLGKVPFEKIGANLDLLLRESTVTIKEAGSFAKRLNTETAPLFQANLIALQKTLEEIQSAIGKDSPLSYNTKKSMEELTLTLRSLRELTNTIENQPQSLLFGKEGDKNE